MANNAEDVIMDGMHTSDKISDRMQREFDKAEYQSKGEETEYMKYPKQRKHFDIQRMEDRKGWNEFQEGLAAEAEGWWDASYGDPVTYDSRGNKIGFDQSNRDMRPKGERLSDESRRSGAEELKFRTDYGRANHPIEEGKIFNDAGVRNEDNPDWVNRKR